VRIERKRAICWLLVVTGFLGVVLSYYGIWGLLDPFSAGLVWYGTLALFISGPTSAIGAAIAYRKPRQKLALALGLFGSISWFILWVLCFTKLGFRLAR
jgi:hypothetical protein